ncbi:MAG: Hsp20/alpha crystallin family protein [Candidatus Gracilibacteria bacterium]
MFSSSNQQQDRSNPFVMLSDAKRKNIIFDDHLHNEEVIQDIEEPAALKSHTAEHNEIDLKVDVYNEPSQIVIVAQAAGVDRNEIAVTVKEEVLTISGERKRPEGLSIDDKYLHTEECEWGKFTRPIILPQNADIKRIHARMTHESLLVLTIPKIDVTEQIVKIEME